MSTPRCECFISAPLPPSAKHNSFRGACLKRRPLPRLRVCTMSLDPTQTLPDLVHHLIMSCGIGLVGLVGTKATEDARAFTAGDRRADYMEKLATDIDSFRRRKELATRPGNRDWADVGVDKFSNAVVIPESIPELESANDLEAFDRLLEESRPTEELDEATSKRTLPSDVLVDPSDFLFAHDDTRRKR